MIIVAGVLLALSVDEWRGELADRRLEQDYIRRLIDDLQVDSIAFADLLRHSEQTNRAARLLLDLVVDPTKEPADETLFVSALEEARSIQNSPWTTGTYDELLATGNMSVLRSGPLKSELNAYFLSLEGLYTWVERRVDRTFRDRSVMLLPTDVREGIYERHFWPAYREVPSDAWLDSAVARVDTRAALEALRAIPDVDMLLGRVVELTKGHSTYLETSFQQQADLLETLRSETQR